ncbi:MAG: hypothetical protein GX493_09615, partial [Firmicutes bacterium]|nr:hypothetical protein [Bacillota bacterium]
LTPTPTLDAISEIPKNAFPRKDEVLRVEFRYRIGGKGITCSRMLKTLGGRSEAVILLGDDSISHCIEDYLRREEVEARILRTQGQGRICLILTEIDQEAPPVAGLIRATGDYRINGSGLRVDAAVMEELLAFLETHLEGAASLALAGSLPEGSPVDFYARCIETARRRVPLVMLDSSGQALLHGVKARPHLVKINGKEAAGLMSVPVPEGIWDALDLARAIARTHGVEKVVITLGSAGAVAVDGKTNFILRAPKVEARGGLGAGDSFFAGLAYSLTRGDPFPQALRWGGACGAATAEQPAGMIGTRERSLALFTKVEVMGMTDETLGAAWHEAAPSGGP